MTHNFKKILIGTGTSVHIQNTMTCNATLYLESKTYNKCKRFPKKRGGGHVSQLCMSEESAHVVKCSNLTLCPCRCTVCTFPVALLNGEDTTVRLKALILSSAKGTWIHRCTRER